ncbi:MAG: DMT family transporter [Bacillota bacterium]
MKNRLRRYSNSIKYFSEGALLFTTIIWGGTFVIVKDSLQDASSMLFIAIRFLIASLFILPFVYKKLFQIDRKSLMKSSLLGVFLFLGFAPQTIGLQYTSATKSGFITGSLVLFTPLMQIVIEKKRPTLGAVVGSFFVLTGLVFLSVKDTSISQLFLELGSDFNFGDFMTLACAFFFSMQVVYIDKISREINFLVLTFIQITVTSILAFISSSILSGAGIEPAHFHLTGNLVFGLAYTAILATIVTFLVQTRFQKEVSPTKAGMIFSFEPMFAAIFAYFMLNEIISLMGIIGGILIFSGLIITELLENLRQKKLEENKPVEEEVTV